MAINKPDINIETIVNGSVVNEKWVGTGSFDKLIGAINQNLELQYRLGRITGGDYATVYLGALQYAIQQGIEFSLRQELVENQIAGAELENNIKDYQNTVLQKDEHEINLKAILMSDAQAREVEDSTLRANTALEDSLLTSVAQRAQINAQKDEILKKSERDDALTSEELITATKQQAVLEADKEIKLFQRSSILPIEASLLEQKIVGKKQSTIIAE